MKIFNAFLIKKKKSKLIKETIEYKTDVDSLLIYNAEILLADNRILMVSDSIDISCPSIVFKICLKNNLYSEKKDLLISKIICKEQTVNLELIETPPQLRNQGLATIVFESWLTLLKRLCDDFNVNITQIKGSVETGGNFIPKYSKKLYKHFDNYQFSKSKKLHLNQEKLNNNILQYKLY